MLHRKKVRLDQLVRELKSCSEGSRANDSNQYFCIHEVPDERGLLNRQSVVQSGLFTAKRDPDNDSSMRWGFLKVFKLTCTKRSNFRLELSIFYIAWFKQQASRKQSKTIFNPFSCAARYFIDLGFMKSIRCAKTFWTKSFVLIASLIMLESTTPDKDR